MDLFHVALANCEPMYMRAKDFVVDENVLAFTDETDSVFFAAPLSNVLYWRRS